MSSAPVELDPERSPQSNATGHKVSLQNLHIEHERLMDCIHCGLCLSQCPTYAELGVEADSPRGRIYLMRALYEGRIEPTPDVTHHLDLCLGCRACETACPSGVQYGYLLEGTRAHLREIGTPHSRKDRLILKAAEMTFPYPRRLDLLLMPIRILRRTGILPLARRLGIMKLFGYLGDLEMLLPDLPRYGKRHSFPQTWRARGEKQASVGMITGCVMPVMLPQVNVSTARVLTRAGCDVAAPAGQVCCGAMHAHTGAMDVAKGLARKNIQVFEAWEKQHGPLDAIVINAAGCGSALKEYPNWFHGEPEWEDRARRFAATVRDVSEFLVTPALRARLQQHLQQKLEPNSGGTGEELGRGEPGPDVPRGAVPNTVGVTSVVGAGYVPRNEAGDNRTNDADSKAGEPRRSPAGARGSFPASEKLMATRLDALPGGETRPTAHVAALRVTYHDACHLAHGQGIRVPPRELLTMLPGLELVPLAEGEMCCGSAGTYNITQPEMALALLERKMKHIGETGASVCVTGNPGCAMQLMLGAKKFGPRVPIKHPIELIDEATR